MLNCFARTVKPAANTGTTFLGAPAAPNNPTPSACSPLRQVVDCGSPIPLWPCASVGSNHAFHPSILTNRKPSPPRSSAPFQPNPTAANPVKPNQTPPPARQAPPQTQPDHQDLNPGLVPGTRPNRNQSPPQSNRIQLNPTESNPIKPDQTESNRIKPHRPPRKPLRKLPPPRAKVTKGKSIESPLELARANA
jgi:hypothetical protein